MEQYDMDNASLAKCSVPEAAADLLRLEEQWRS
jgi:hypothetical protein